jgi:allophanate hydrolase subunit 2
VLGPRADWFTAKGVKTLLSQDWQVTAESSRVGMRLSGTVPLERRDASELPSEGTALGAIQVPHSGQPVLFLADHPLTGGYPVIGVVALHHLDLVGQIPIGACIHFNPVAVKETGR